MATTNREVLLARRPECEITDDCFVMRETPLAEPGEGEILVKNLYLSLDPAMRGCMRETKSYVEPIPVGGIMRGATISEVVESRVADFSPGDKLIGMNVWAEYSVVRPGGLRKLPDGLPLPLTA